MARPRLRMGIKKSNGQLQELVYLHDNVAGTKYISFTPPSIVAREGRRIFMSSTQFQRGVILNPKFGIGLGLQ